MDHQFIFSTKQMIEIGVLAAAVLALIVQSLISSRRDRLMAFIEAARKPDFQFRTMSQHVESGVRKTYIYGSIEGHHFMLSEETHAAGRTFYRLEMLATGHRRDIHPQHFGHETFAASRGERLLAEVFPKMLAAATLRDQFARRQKEAAHASR